MKSLTLIAIACALALSGCAAWFTADTEVSIPVPGKDGQLLGMATYKSDKEQTDFQAEYDPETGKLSVSTGKAATPEQAIVESAKATNTALGILGTALKAAPIP